MNKKSEYGKKIRDAKSKHTYSKVSSLILVLDNIVIDLIKPYFLDSEYKEDNYIIEGYPRTRIQAIELQRMKVVPDKFFILTANQAVMEEKVKANIISTDEGKTLSAEEITKLSKSIVEEYLM